VVDNSLTGADVNESTLAGVLRGRMLDLNMFAGDPEKRIAAVGPYALKGQCFYVSANTLVMQVSAKGPAGSFETEFSKVENDAVDKGNRSLGEPLSSNTNTRVLVFDAGSGFSRAGGTLVLRSNSGTMVQVGFSAAVDTNAGTDGACHLWGSATTGT
jgi:hypothetical protein